MEKEPLIEKGRDYFLAKWAKKKFWGNLKKYWLVWLLLLLVIGWFYWFQWRPSKIRMECAKETTLTLSEKERTITNFQKSYDLLYEACLNKRGLK